MGNDGTPVIRSAEVELPGGPDLEATRVFFTDHLGFSLESIYPADDPGILVVSGHGVRLRFDRRGTGDPGVLRLRTDAEIAGLVAPNGTRVEFIATDGPGEAPLVPSFVLTRAGSKAKWAEGRAGMRYRDLIPDRLGGRFIASHIRISKGGPVADYVHHHDVQFQVIYCYRGWVKVVYEDQGPPFVMHAGDCVLQPPGIRHRVLECSAGLEVIEVGGANFQSPSPTSQAGASAHRRIEDDSDCGRRNRRPIPSMRSDESPGVLRCHVSCTLRNEYAHDSDSEEARLS